MWATVKNGAHRRATPGSTGCARSHRHDGAGAISTSPPRGRRPPERGIALEKLVLELEVTVDDRRSHVGVVAVAVTAQIGLSAKQPAMARAISTMAALRRRRPNHLLDTGLPALHVRFVDLAQDRGDVVGQRPAGVVMRRTACCRRSTRCGHRRGWSRRRSTQFVRPAISSVIAIASMHRAVGVPAAAEVVDLGDPRVRKNASNAETTSREWIASRTCLPP